MAAMRPCAFVTALLNCIQSVPCFCSRVTVTPAVGWPLCKSRMHAQGIGGVRAKLDRLWRRPGRRRFFSDRSSRCFQGEGRSSSGRGRITGLLGTGAVLQGATATGHADSADHLPLGHQRQAATEQQQLRHADQIAHVRIVPAGRHGQRVGIAFGGQGRVGLAPAGFCVVGADAVGALHGDDIAAPVQYADDDVPALCPQAAAAALARVLAAARETSSTLRNWACAGLASRHSRVMP